MVNETINETVLNTGIGLIDKIFSPIITKLVVVTTIILVGFIFGKLVEKFLHRILSDIAIDKTLKKTTGRNIPIEDIVSKFVSYFIYFTTIIFSLNQAGLSTDILNLISAAVLILIIVLLILGIKDFIPNAISGISLLNRGFIKVGDEIKIDGLHGNIDKINLLETYIITKDGDTISIPNSVFSKKEVVRINIKI